MTSIAQNEHYGEPMIPFTLLIIQINFIGQTRRALAYSGEEKNMATAVAKVITTILLSIITDISI